MLASSVCLSVGSYAPPARRVAFPSSSEMHSLSSDVVPQMPGSHVLTSTCLTQGL